MAFPVILVNSSTGSDSAASGAGPSTAITGTSASTSSDGLTVTLDGSPDLSGVATDGSAVIYLNHTAGRNFSAISAADNSAKTVTVTGQAFTGSLTGKSWAIGGKRASICGTASKKLFDNGGAAGDAMPGWIVELEDGHSETASGTLDLRRAGDTTNGPVILRGASGASTRPVLDFSADTNGIVPRGSYQHIKDIDLTSSGVKSTSTLAAINFGASGIGNAFVRIKINTSGTNAWYNGIYGTTTATGNIHVLGCEVGNCKANGIKFTTGGYGSTVAGNYIHDNGATAIDLSASQVISDTAIIGNIIANHTSGTSHGIDLNQSRTDAFGGIKIQRNTIYNCSGDGLRYQSWNAAISSVDISNNLFYSNGGYGVNFSNGSASPAGCNAYFPVMTGNAYGSNTSGESVANGSALIHEIGKVSTVTLDNASFGTSGNFSLGSSSTAKAAGWPSVIGYSSTTNYLDIGAAQREEPAGGGGGTVYVPQGGGGFGVWRS